MEMVLNSFLSTAKILVYNYSVIIIFSFLVGTIQGAIIASIGLKFGL